MKLKWGTCAPNLHLFGIDAPQNLHLYWAYVVMFW